MCICVYHCKYCNKLCYKAPICGMVFNWSCCHDVLLLSSSFIVNTATSYVIKLHGKYVLFLVVMLVIGVIKHQGWCSPKGEGSVTALVKIPCKNI